LARSACSRDNAIGSVPKRLADRALRCIEREKLRQFHLKVD
jgi:hypothetical protein